MRWRTGGSTAEEGREGVERTGRQRGDDVALKTGMDLRTTVVLSVTLFVAMAVGYGLGLVNILDSIPQAPAFLAAHLQSLFSVQATPDAALAVLVGVAWLSSLVALWRRFTAGIVLLDLGLSLGTAGAALVQLLAGVVTLKVGLAAGRPILIVAAESLVLFAIASLLAGRTQVRERAVIVGLWRVYPWRRLVAYDLSAIRASSRPRRVPIAVTVAQRGWSMLPSTHIVLRPRQVQYDKMAALLIYRVQTASSPRRSA